MTDLILDFFQSIYNDTIQQHSLLSRTEIQWLACLDVEDYAWVISRFITDPKFVYSINIIVAGELFLYIVLFYLIIEFGLSYKHKPAAILLEDIGIYSNLSVLFVLVATIYQLLHAALDENYGCLDKLIETRYMDIYAITFSSYFLKIFILVIWIGLSKFSKSLTNSSGYGIAEFPILSHLVLCLSLTLTSVTNFALFLICLEGLSLILYIMATVGRLHGGIAAASKYFLFGTAGSVLVLWGAINLYESTTSLSYYVLFHIFDYLQNDMAAISPGLHAKLTWSSSIILIGLIVKLGAAPVHQWVPDVYSGVPMFITSFYSIFIKFVLYTLFIKLAYHLNISSELEYAAILSLVVGCFGTLRQSEIKRFLAYGSITHTGFLLIGDINSSFIYLFSYVLASFAIFSILLNFRINNIEFNYLSDFRYFASYSDQSERLLITFALSSIAGLPPFSGFYGKIIIWSSLIEDIYLYSDFISLILLIVNLVVSIIIIFYYMRLVIFLFVGDEHNLNEIITMQYESFRVFLPMSRVDILNIKQIQLVFLFMLVAWTIVVPTILEMTTLMSESFFIV